MAKVGMRRSDLRYDVVGWDGENRGGNTMCQFVLDANVNSSLVMSAQHALLVI